MKEKRMIKEKEKNAIDMKKYWTENGKKFKVIPREKR